MNFEFQPTLIGELIELRPLREADWQELFTAASDPLIWEQHPEPNRYTEEAFQKYFLGAMECGGAFAVVDRKTGSIIGSSRYMKYFLESGSVADNVIEIGFSFLARARKLK